MDIVFCILNLHISVFFLPWHDQASIFGHWQDVFCKLWQSYHVFSYNLSSNQLHNLCCHNMQSTF
jgi:hypothetical protein